MKTIKNQFVFFYPEWDTQYSFSIQDARIVHQLKNVLRKKSGTTIMFLNGAGEKLIVRVIIVHKEIICEPIKHIKVPKESCEIHLIVGTPKKESLKDILKYGTQLGMSSLTLVDMEYSQIKSLQYSDKHLYWSHILQESLEQSIRVYLPSLNYTSHLEGALLDVGGKENILVADIGSEERPLPYLSQICASLDHKQDFIFIIGPEGGFSSKEYQILKKYNHISYFTLSDNILRVETAVMSCIISTQTILTSQILR